MCDLKLLHAFFYKQHFYKQCQAENDKIQVKAQQHPEAELFLFENYSLSSRKLSFKDNGSYSKNIQKTSASVLMRLND